MLTCTPRKQSASKTFLDNSAFGRVACPVQAPSQILPQCLARRALALLFLRCLLYRFMLASFCGDDAAAVLAHHALVSAFEFHRSITKDSVCRRDFTVCQPTLGQSFQQSPNGAVRSSVVGLLCAKPQVGDRDRLGGSQEDSQDGPTILA